MNRHYYISDNLDELERLEAELEASGIATEQIHVLSERTRRPASAICTKSPFMKKDVVRSGRVGLLVGLVLAIVAVAFAYASGWTETAAGWIPVIFLGAVLCAFCLWEGSFFGLQRTNRAFRPFEERLHQGQHLFFVDVKNAQEPILVNVVSHHPRLQDAGTGPAVSRCCAGSNAGGSSGGWSERPGPAHRAGPAPSLRLLEYPATRPPSRPARPVRKLHETR